MINANMGSGTELSHRLCIGLTGRMASGKGEAAKILQQRGYRYISLSDIVREEAAKGRRTVNRRQMQDIGNRLRQEGGAGILGQRVREKILVAAERKWVVDGIRHPDEVAELRRIDRFVLIGIDAPIDIICLRIRSRARQTDDFDETELRRILDREWGIGQPPDGQQVGRCVALSDFIVTNDTSLEALTRRLDSILSRIGDEYE